LILAQILGYNVHGYGKACMVYIGDTEKGNIYEGGPGKGAIIEGIQVRRLMRG
jgi:hypothetical protein